MKNLILYILLLAVGHSVAMEVEILDVDWDLSAECEPENDQPVHQSKLSQFEQQLFYHQRLLVDSEVAPELLPVAGNFVSPTHTGAYILYPLHLAIRHNKLGCVKWLLKKGANANGQDHLGKRPLHLAIVADDSVREKLIHTLCFYGALVDGADKQGSTPLSLAVQYNKPDVVAALLAKDANPNIQVDAEQRCYERNIHDIYAVGMSPLYAAASAGNEEIVSLLLAKRARIKQTEHVAAQICYKGLKEEPQKALFARVLGLSKYSGKVARANSY